MLNYRRFFKNICKITMFKEIKVGEKYFRKVESKFDKV